MRQFQPTDRPLALYVRAFGSMFAEIPGTPPPFELLGPAAIVDIRGPLVQQAGGWLDYDTVVRSVRAAAQSPARAVVLRVDSPGGDALGMAECARELRAIATASRKPLIAFIYGMSCSAAFALTSAATCIITPPAGLLGSVGVYQPIVDATAADATMGLKWTMISSGEAKLDGNPHTTPSDGSLARTQLRVDGLASLFFDLVAEMRPGVTASKMRSLEGATFLGAEAVQAGLADRVGSWSDVLDMVSNDQTATASASAPAKEKAMADEVKDDKKSKARKAFFGAMESAFDAMFGDDDDDDKKKDEPKKDEGASTAAAEDPKKDEPKKDDDASAKALALSFATAKEMAALKAKIAAGEDATSRAALLAKRPDFDASILALLADVPLAKVREAVETFPRIGAVRLRAVAMPVGTAGETQTGDPTDTGLEQSEKDRVARAFGGSRSAVASSYIGGVQELGYVTPEQARARLEQIMKEGVK